MEKYEKPEMEVIAFNEEEIRTAFDPINNLDSTEGLGGSTPLGNSF